MVFFKLLDKTGFLNIRVWDFSIKSLVRNYGMAFISGIIIRHPFRTITGIKKYQILNKTGEFAGKILVEPEHPGKCIDKHKSVTGAGFCLKPLDPGCISGRANHDCIFFENNLHLKKNHEPLCCRECMIKKIGLMALYKRSSFYIMTSAKDILYDIFQPSVETGKYSKGLFFMCKYSFEPFKIALLISGIQACLYPFETGDCKDYKAWLKADTGIKDEQTTLSNTFNRIIDSILSVTSSKSNIKFKKTGNIFYPYD
jgi:hypothetical protein